MRANFCLMLVLLVALVAIPASAKWSVKITVPETVKEILARPMIKAAVAKFAAEIEEEERRASGDEDQNYSTIDSRSAQNTAVLGTLDAVFENMLDPRYRRIVTSQDWDNPMMDQAHRTLRMLQEQFGWRIRDKIEKHLADPDQLWETYQQHKPQLVQEIRAHNIETKTVEHLQAFRPHLDGTFPTPQQTAHIQHIETLNELLDITAYGQGWDRMNQERKRVRSSLADTGYNQYDADWVQRRRNHWEATEETVPTWLLIVDDLIAELQDS